MSDVSDPNFFQRIARKLACAALIFFSIHVQHHEQREKGELFREYVSDLFDFTCLRMRLTHRRKRNVVKSYIYGIFNLISYILLLLVIILFGPLGVLLSKMEEHPGLNEVVKYIEFKRKGYATYYQYMEQKDSRKQKKRKVETSEKKSKFSGWLAKKVFG